MIVIVILVVVVVLIVIVGTRNLSFRNGTPERAAEGSRAGQSWQEAVAVGIAVAGMGRKGRKLLLSALLSSLFLLNALH